MVTSVYHRQLTNTWEGGVTEDRRDSFLPFLPVREAAAPYVWGLLSPAWHLNSLHVATSPGCLFLPRSSPAVPSWPLDLRRSVQSAGGHVLARDAKRRDTCLCRVVHGRRLLMCTPEVFRAHTRLLWRAHAWMVAFRARGVLSLHLCMRMSVCRNGIVAMVAVYLRLWFVMETIGALVCTHPSIGMICVKEPFQGSIQKNY